jgi:hypothetical protein
VAKIRVTKVHEWTNDEGTDLVDVQCFVTDYDLPAPDEVTPRSFSLATALKDSLPKDLLASKLSVHSWSISHCRYSNVSEAGRLIFEPESMLWTQGDLCIRTEGSVGREIPFIAMHPPHLLRTDIADPTPLFYFHLGDMNKDKDGIDKFNPHWMLPHAGPVMFQVNFTFSFFLRLAKPSRPGLSLVN